MKRKDRFKRGHAEGRHGKASIGGKTSGAQRLSGDCGKSTGCKGPGRGCGDEHHLRSNY